MNPDQPAAPPSNTGQYDFIMNPQKPAGGGKYLSLGGSSFILKVLLILGGAAVLMIVLAIVVNIFFGSKTNIDDIVSLAQTQTEVVRVSAEGGKANDQALRNAAESARETVGSHQQGLLAYLKKHGRTVKTKELGLKKNTNTDKLLLTAQQSNTFDTTYRQILRSELETYRTQIRLALDHAGDELEKSLLSAEYKETDTLLKLLPAQ
jgi:hypothetical protein